MLAQLNLPRMPVDEGGVTTVGVIAIASAIAVALLGLMLGGAVGTRFHRTAASTASSFQLRTPAISLIAGVLLYTGLLS